MTERQRPTRADTLRSVSVTRLKRGKLQPRRAIDGPSLAKLAKSIQSEGVIQPLFVRKVSTGSFEILAGERRWHAAKMAGLRRVPTVVRNVSDASALAISLVENLHREDLNPIDQALAIERLVDRFGMTHAEVADTIGRSRATVTNLLRLLDLPASVRAMIADGRIDMGHARALLALPPDEQWSMATATVEKGLSVREVERRVSVRKAAAAEVQQGGRSGVTALQPDVSAAASDSGHQLDWLRERLDRSLGTSTSLGRRRGGRWRLDVSFGSIDELASALDAVLKLLEERP